MRPITALVLAYYQNERIQCSLRLSYTSGSDSHVWLIVCGGENMSTMTSTLR